MKKSVEEMQRRVAELQSAIRKEKRAEQIAQKKQAQEQELQYLRELKTWAKSYMLNCSDGTKHSVLEVFDRSHSAS